MAKQRTLDGLTKANIDTYSLEQLVLFFEIAQERYEGADTPRSQAYWANRAADLNDAIQRRGFMVLPYRFIDA